MSEDTPHAKIPWGCWVMNTNKWYPNDRLQMTAQEQHRQNIANGYSDENTEVLGAQ